MADRREIRIIDTTQSLGEDVATPNEAREMLGLTSGRGSPGKAATR